MPSTRLVRGLVRTPALTVAATVCIAIGVAATTAVATLANAVILRPVPFPDADRLYRIWLEEPGIDSRVWLSIPEALEIQPSDLFEQVLPTARVRAIAIHGDGAERLRGEGVAPGYFERLGLRVALGRPLHADDHASAAAPAIVIGHRLWTRAYGASLGAIGTILRTQRAAYTIVGVAPPGFNGTVEDDDVEFWVPIEHYEPRATIADRDSRQTWALVSVRPGVDAAAVAESVEALTRDWQARFPDRYRTLRLRSEPFGDSWRAGLRGGTGMLGAAAGLLLLIAAVNVGCLLLARVLDRRREFAIRRALGAGRGRLVGQLLVEALVLCAAGGLVGMLAGPAVLSALLSIAPITLPAYLVVEPDARVVAIAFACLLVSGVLAGTVPALVGSRTGPAEALQSGARGVVGRARERRWIGLLICGETALTLVILVAGGLLLRSFDRYSTLDLGYARSGIARLAVTLSSDDAGSAGQRSAVYQRLADAVAAVPGVTASGLAAPTLPPWDPQRGRVQFAEIAAAASSDGLPAGVHLADHGLLPALGIRVLAGRNFHPSEADRVAIISRGLASRMGGEAAALGRTITVRPVDHGDPEGAFRIVGVAGDVAYDGFAEQTTRRLIRYSDGADPRAGRWDVYLPLARFPVTTVSIAATTTGDPAPLIEAARRAIGRVAPTSAVHWTSTMDDEVALEYAPARFYGVLVSAFSASALLLTSVGLFALLWNSAAARTGEMGLRLALGARRAGIGWLLISSGARPVLLGVSLGLLAALWCADAIGALLYEVPALDPLSFGGATLLLLLVSLTASLLPARRAASVDPGEALKGP
jgi:putative ABC transport system permease protein